MNEEKTRKIEEQIAYESARTGPPEGFPQFPDIPAGRYTDPEFFRIEQGAIWTKTWLFAGHMEDLPEPGSYFRWNDAGTPLVIVRGRDNEVRAFYNTCRHRGAPVVTQDKGNAPTLRCGYHSWTYNLDGELIGVPDERDFVGLDKSCRALMRVRCETWGSWIFINRDADAMPLMDYLGPLPSEVDDFQIEKLRFTGKESFELACNWKVAVDAFLETYHLPHIHAHTVDRLINHLGTAIGLFEHGHSRMPTPVNANKIQDRWNLQMPFNIESVGDIGRNTNLAYNVFPNLVMPMEPTGFPVLLFWPLDLRRTRLDAVWFGADWGKGDKPEAWDGFQRGFGVVLAEDTQFLSSIQSSLDSPAFEGVPLSYQERRIYHLHEQIDRIIGPENIPEHLRIKPLLAPYIED